MEKLHCLNRVNHGDFTGFPSTQITFVNAAYAYNKSEQPYKGTCKIDLISRENHNQLTQRQKEENYSLVNVLCLNSFGVQTTVLLNSFPIIILV